MLHVLHMTATYSENMHVKLFALLLGTKDSVVSPLKSVQINSRAGLFCLLSVSSHPCVDKFYNKI